MSKLWRIGDHLERNGFLTSYRGETTFIDVKGKVITRYPDFGVVDIMDERGHVWRVSSGNYGR